MKTLGLSGVLASLLILTQLICAQESAKFEKIRDISPEQKFGRGVGVRAGEQDAIRLGSGPRAFILHSAQPDIFCLGAL